ncbi:MAG TPA: penicillin-insensitive murein endopeptidase [Ramlibacter sp.]|jgi:penicillin-insensitive murein endopeptidase|nr:penicillin-insensitive murein endopeptidase [Ramlibacter sp.]
MPVLLAACLLAPVAATAQSTCYGTPGNGRVEGTVSLPREGPNFVRMAQGPISAGRVYVHSLVHTIVLDAFAALAVERPTIRWVYGETGLAQGGPIPPHQTHQNGTSVDLFVPVVDKQGNAVQFPNRADNGYGYQVDFNAAGENATHTIDYANLGELLYQLHVSARKHGSGLALVVFERELRPPLFRTARGTWLKSNIPFPNWDDRVRHDDHIHVNFVVPCK